MFIPLLLLILFVVFPAAKLLSMSLTDWDGLSKNSNFIGLDNYKKIIFNSPEVWISLRNNAIYLFGHLLFFPLEIMVAFMLHRIIKGNKFFKTVVFLPYIINGVAVAYVFAYFFSPQNGALNSMMEAAKLGNMIQPWLSGEKVVNFTLLFVSLWRYSGQHVILFLAGIQAIPEELYEAAKMDGANAFQQFKNIIIPGIITVIEILLFMNARGALQMFDIPFLMTSGGPGYASSTFTLYTINTAFTFNSFGLAASMAILLIIIILILTQIQKRILNYSRGD